MRPHIDNIDFDKHSMTVRVDIVGHPTDALEQARIVIHNILEGHGAWCITRINGSMTADSKYPSEFRMHVEGERME